MSQKLTFLPRGNAKICVFLSTYPPVLTSNWNCTFPERTWMKRINAEEKYLEPARIFLSSVLSHVAKEHLIIA
jgi:hypothetical protein